jgi:3-hydroxyisobutyrate dehydrogenase-like beta-hydroxyacid dehydrogenase
MCNDKARIGWIGSGRMGTAMATRLIDRENDVIVANRTRAKAQVLAELGPRLPIDILIWPIAISSS